MLNSDIKKKFYNGKEILEQRWSGQTIWGHFATWEKYSIEQRWVEVQSFADNPEKFYIAKPSTGTIRYKKTLTGPEYTANESQWGNIKVGDYFYSHVSTLDGFLADSWRLIVDKEETTYNYQLIYSNTNMYLHQKVNLLGTVTGEENEYPFNGVQGGYWYKYISKETVIDSHNDKTNWEPGNINGGTGELTTSSTYVRTKDFYSIKGATFKIDSTEIVANRFPAIFFYDDNNIFMGRYSLKTTDFVDIVTNATKYKLNYYGSANDIPNINATVSFK